MKTLNLRAGCRVSMLIVATNQDEELTKMPASHNLLLAQVVSYLVNLVCMPRPFQSPSANVERCSTICASL